MEKEKVLQLDSNVQYPMISQGNTAEILQYEDGKIIKLFRDGMPFEAVSSEYEKTKTVQEVLENIPKVYEMAMYKERYGIIYEQITGSDLIEEMVKNPSKIVYYAKLMALLHKKMHQKQVNLLTAKDKLSYEIRGVEELSKDEKEKLLERLNMLPDKKMLCHFDFHPGNIMMKEEKTVIIDWMTVCAGDPCADVARTLILLTYGDLPHGSIFTKVSIHIFKKIIKKIYYKEYIKETGISDADVKKWMVPIAAARLSEWTPKNEKDKLLTFIRKNI